LIPSLPLPVQGVSPSHHLQGSPSFFPRDSGCDPGYTHFFFYVFFILLLPTLPEEGDSSVLQCRTDIATLVAAASAQVHPKNLVKTK
jgi:hypothetical protein